MSRRWKNNGWSIDINLKDYGYNGYIVECIYYFDKSAGKYLVTMWLKKADVDARFQIGSEKIDTQYLSGTKESICHNLTRVVEDGCSGTFFEKYIERIEYNLMCMERGNEVIEKETLNAL